MNGCVPSPSYPPAAHHPRSQVPRSGQEGNDNVHDHGLLFVLPILAPGSWRPAYPMTRPLGSRSSLTVPPFNAPTTSTHPFIHRLEPLFFVAYFPFAYPFHCVLLVYEHYLYSTRPLIRISLAWPSPFHSESDHFAFNCPILRPEQFPSPLLSIHIHLR